MNSKQDLRSILDQIKNYDENDVRISIIIGFQRSYKVRLLFLRKSC